jgi:hypothetical protein
MPGMNKLPIEKRTQILNLLVKGSSWPTHRVSRRFGLALARPHSILN